jgi:hypothetical protein
MEWWLVRDLGHNWLALVSQTALSVVAPVRTRLRRTMVLGESARCSLPWTRLDKLIPDSIADTAQVTLKAIHTGDHNCSIHELVTLAAVSKWIAPQRALEIGTYDGRSALAIAANMPGHLWTMNLPPTIAESPGQDLNYDAKLALKVESGYRFKGTPESARITQVFADSTTFDYKEMGKDMGPFQYVFIDGCHEESVVLLDTARAMGLMDRTNSVILWHDATRFGVRPALQSLRAKGHKISLVLGTTIAILRYKDGNEVELPY